jgi:glucose-1-phosphate adenylyltransferase
LSRRNGAAWQMENILAILLAGGVGERLHPLTQKIAKPAVRFGGIYRIIDFTLSNCINSGVRKIYVLTQYKSLELIRHLREGWNILSRELGEFIEAIPPMKRVHEDWYLGTADAVYQNLESVLDQDSSQTLILGADHIYKMDYHDMVDWHRREGADVTIATIQTPPHEAKRFGICEMNDSHRVIGFEEKPQHGNPKRSVFNPDMTSVSMGIYIFNTPVLVEALKQDAACPNSSHDFGKDILPWCLDRFRVVGYDFHDLNRTQVLYWRDVGTLDAYYEANMDLVSVSPEFNLYDQAWPIRTGAIQQPPAKFVFASEGRRMGVALDSMISPGCIISGGRVVRSILSPAVRVNSWCEIESSILLTGVQVGRYARVRCAIVPPRVVIPEHAVIGFDRDEDRAKGYVVTEGGIVVLPPTPTALDRS